MKTRKPRFSHYSELAKKTGILVASIRKYFWLHDLDVKQEADRNHYLELQKYKKQYMGHSVKENKVK